MTEPPIHQSRLIFLAMDNASSPDFQRLKERFEAFDLCADKRTAAAFGYMLAKQEANQTEPWDEPMSVYEEVCTLIEGYSEGVTDLESSADKVFGAVYQWLSKAPGIDEPTIKGLFSSCLPPSCG